MANRRAPSSYPGTSVHLLGNEPCRSSIRSGRSLMMKFCWSQRPINIASSSRMFINVGFLRRCNPSSMHISFVTVLSKRPQLLMVSSKRELTKGGTKSISFSMLPSLFVESLFDGPHQTPESLLASLVACLVHHLLLIATLQMSSSRLCNPTLYSSSYQLMPSYSSRRWTSLAQIIS